jgi:hypothetical protein
MVEALPKTDEAVMATARRTAPPGVHWLSYCLAKTGSLHLPSFSFVRDVGTPAIVRDVGMAHHEVR